MKIKRKTKAFTLVELLIVIGIMAVMSAGMYAIYSNVSLSQKSTQEINNLNILKGGIENLFAASSDYTGLDQALIAKSSIPSATMMKGSDKVVNAWGNEYTIAPIDVGGVAANFTIETNIPKKACEKIVSALAGTWSGVEVESQAIKTRGLSDYDTANMVNICDTAGGASDQVKITVYDNDSK